MEEGRGYTVVFGRGESKGTFRKVVTTELGPPWSPLEGWWLFDVRDNDTENAGTHPVFVNPANALTVIPDRRG